MPRNVCCIPGCSVIAGDNISLHYFPNPNGDLWRFQSWVKAVGGDFVSLDSTTIHKTQRICRRHFEDQYLYPKNRLCKLAVPSLFLPSVNLADSSKEEKPPDENNHIDCTTSRTIHENNLESTADTRAQDLTPKRQKIVEELMEGIKEIPEENLESFRNKMKLIFDLLKTSSSRRFINYNKKE